MENNQEKISDEDLIGYILNDIEGTKNHEIKEKIMVDKKLQLNLAELKRLHRSFSKLNTSEKRKKTFSLPKKLIFNTCFAFFIFSLGSYAQFQLELIKSDDTNTPVSFSQKIENISWDVNLNSM